MFIAAPLLAATLTRDARQIAGIETAVALPWLVFSLPAGALVDRWDRRKVMWTVDTLRTVIVAVIAIAAGTGHAKLPLLYTAFFLLGVGQVFFDNADQAFLPEVVDDGNLERANARLQAGTLGAGQLAGPAIGSLLFSLAVALPFAFDATTFAAAAFLVFTIQRTARAPEATKRIETDAADATHQTNLSYATDAPDTPDATNATNATDATDAPDATNATDGTNTTDRPTIRADVVEGLRYLLGHKLLRTLAIILGSMNLLDLVARSTFVLFAQDQLHLSDLGFGIVLTMWAVGGIAGGLIADRLGARRPRHILAMTIALMAVGYGAIPIFANAIVTGAAFFLSGIAGVVWNVVTVSARQQIIPRTLFGRVNSVYRLLSWGTMPVGAAIGGLIAHRYGLRGPYWVALFGHVVLFAAAIRWLPLTAIDAARLAAQSAPETSS